MTPPQRRRAKNQDLPENLYSRQRGSTTYYFWRHPETKREFPLGKDRAHAKKAARLANEKVAPADLTSVVNQMVEQRSAITLGEYADRYIEEVLPARRIKGKELSQAYMTETRRIFRRICDHFGRDKALEAITRRDVAEYLATLGSNDAFNQHRTRLSQMLRNAISEGHIEVNVAEQVIKRDKEARVRQRLTVDQYAAIFHHASFGIQSAMELSLNAQQRRTDIHQWHRAQQTDGYAHIVQSKTRAYGPSAHLRIPLGLPCVHSERGCGTLAELIASCWWDDVPSCPYLVHEKRPNMRKGGKDHVYQLTLKRISEGFAEARAATGLFKDWPEDECPTFHELLALGGHLLETRLGWPEENIQALRGHTSRSTTEIYLEGHTWTTFEVPG